MVVLNNLVEPSLTTELFELYGVFASLHLCWAKQQEAKHYPPVPRNGAAYFIFFSAFPTLL